MKSLRIYVATQDNCVACEQTLKTLGDSVNGVPVYEVDLSSDSSSQRRQSMGVTATPTIFIVGGEDDNNNGIWEEIEEKHIWHQSGLIADKTNLEKYIDVIKEDGVLVTTV